MRLLIQDTLKNMYKLDDKNKKDILKHANNISDENFKGNHYDIEAFSLLTGFNIILFNYDYTVDNNINIVKNDNSTIVYLIQNENKNHIDALIPKNNCLYINYEFYKTIAKNINDKIICKYNENNNLNDKIINNSMLDNNSKPKFKNQKEDKNRKDLIIDDSVNKTVAENIKCKNIINSRKVINFLNHDYAILFKGSASPIFTIKEYLKIENDKIINDNNIVKFTVLCEKFKFKGDKTDIQDLINNEIIKNNSIIIDVDINTKDIINKYKLSMEVLRNIGPCIDLQCSGINLLGNKVYRVFNNYKL